MASLAFLQMLTDCLLRVIVASVTLRYSALHCVTEME